MATLINKLLTMHDTVEIHSADGKRVLAEVKKQLVSLTHGAKVTVTGMQFPLEVKGDFRGKNFQVRRSLLRPPSQRHRQASFAACRCFACCKVYSLPAGQVSQDVQHLPGMGRSSCCQSWPKTVLSTSQCTTHSRLYIEALSPAYTSLNICADHATA